MTVRSSLSVMLLCLAAIFFTPLAATGSDTAKELRWAEQVSDSLLDGDTVWLDSGFGHKFLGILTEGNPDTGRTVVLIHGLGVHPNWPDVIYPLRAGLLEQGVTSLSIQMPILANDADPDLYQPLFVEVPQRIDGALEALDGAGYRKITLVAHSLGAAITVDYLSQVSPDQVDSLIIIGMPPGFDGNENITRSGQLRLQVLDLYGSADLEAVLASAPEREVAGKKTSSSYRQKRVADANHFFQGHEEELVQQVVEWLDTIHQQGG